MSSTKQKRWPLWPRIVGAAVIIATYANGLLAVAAQSVVAALVIGVLSAMGVHAFFSMASAEEAAWQEALSEVRASIAKAKSEREAAEKAMIKMGVLCVRRLQKAKHYEAALRKIVDMAPGYSEYGRAGAGMLSQIARDALEAVRQDKEVGR